MKKFHFSLQKVLEVAKAEEKMALEEFAKAQKKLADEKAWIKSLSRKLSLLRESIVLKDIMELKNQGKYGLVLQKQIEFSEQRLAELEVELENKRLFLIEKLKKRQLLENLKGKAWLKYQKELEKEEQLFLDEIGVTRFARKEEESI